mgnify:CR=1 FL=1
MKFLKLYFSFSCVIFLLASSCSNDSKESVENEKAVDSILNVINEQLKDEVNNDSLYVLRAERYFALGEYEYAFNDIIRAINLDSKNCEYNCTYSRFYLDLKKYNEGKQVLDNILKVNSECTCAVLMLADIAFVYGDFNQSIKYIDEVLKVDMYNPDAYFKKGLNFLALNDSSKAISSFQTAVEQNPKFIESYINLGVLYAGKRNPLAEEYYKTALQLDSTRYEVHYNLAMYYQENEMINEALKKYTQLTKKYPNKRELYFNIGYIHLVKLKLYREATNYFNQAIAVDPNYFEAYFNKGYCLELLGDIMNAEEEYKKSLEIKPEYTPAALGLGRVRGELDINNQPIK